ncbi:MAG: hypothetical protein MUC77_21230 [Chromatiaceae bacterium]|nr:hypothetical protein [Chromatiaceae bacterium]
MGKIPRPAEPLAAETAERASPLPLGKRTMDRFTRNYLIGLVAVVAALVATWLISSWDPGAARLNKRLAADAELAAYPYAFRVVSVQNGMATMKSPRSFEVPVAQFLAVIEPRVAGTAPEHPDMVAAQARLAEHQKRAQAIVEAEPEVRSVRWVLDRDWYAARGVPLP